jgi:hypothetical protein
MADRYYLHREEDCGEADGAGVEAAVEAQGVQRERRNEDERVRDDPREED